MIQIYQKERRKERKKDEIYTLEYETTYQVSKCFNKTSIQAKNYDE